MRSWLPLLSVLFATGRAAPCGASVLGGRRHGREMVLQKLVDEGEGDRRLGIRAVRKLIVRSLKLGATGKQKPGVASNTSSQTRPKSSKPLLL